MKKCKKIQYANEQEASQRLLEINENNGKKKLKQVYKCKHCKSWHLSSMSKKRFEKIKQILSPSRKAILQKTGLTTRSNWKMSESKAYLEATYKVPVYVTWDKVPADLHTKTALKKAKKWKEDLQPAGIKGGGLNPTWYFLYRANEETILKPA